MAEAPRIRSSKNFIQYLIDQYEKEYGRDFTFPKATDRLLQDIQKMKMNEMKRKRL